MTAVKTMAVIPAKINGTPINQNATPEVKMTSSLPKIEHEKLPPLDDRLHRLNVLFEIQGKYNRLQTSLQKLKKFFS